MCGITGFLNDRPLGERDRELVSTMAARLQHRGPDAQGIWLDESAGVAFGHRRLSIIDLSAAGAQPMQSASGRYVICYNGELYNHRQLREELAGVGAAPAWRGHSDTEVLLAAIEHWGIRGALAKANAMFAMAIWDRSDRTLYLARDRLGEKPLYYGVSRGIFLFGSELKAITAHPSFEGRIDRDAVTLFLRHGYIPAPFSIWEGISKLPPAHLLVVRDGGRCVESAECYWDLQALAERSAADPRRDTPGLVDELETLLTDAIGLRMEADVPLGAFLSGGIDSSVVVALMQKQARRPVRTFTIGFDQANFNEAEHAKAVANHLGTDHTELYVSSEAARDLIPALPAIWDEPFADSSQIPTYLVSKMTREHVTVALSGDGGDELFGGYNRYFLATSLWKARNALPNFLRPMAIAALESPRVGRAADMISGLLPRRLRMQALGDRLPKVAEVLREPSLENLYLKLVSHWKQPADMVPGGSEPITDLTGRRPDFADFRQKMMLLDTLTYLPDDILTKVDRASMAVSLEARVPLLDPRVVEFAWSLPMSAKIRGQRGKHLLREVLYRHVPPSLIDRPKMGFGLPIDEWLRGPLREWADDLLAPSRLRESGLLDPKLVTGAWQEHRSGTRRRHYLIWDILMLESWLQSHAKG